MTPTTFTISYGNRTYQRCLSELRKYRAQGVPSINTGVAPDESTSFVVGGFVAYKDTDDPDDPDSKRYHVGKVVNLADGEAHVHCYATHGKALSRAKWKELYQSDTGVYATGDSNHGEAVIDRIPTEEEDWMVHYNVKL